jgi:hypothetical protein
MKISNITITILILTLNSYTFGQNTIYRGGGISNVAVNQTYNSNNNIMFQTNNTNVLITNNINNTSRNYIQKSNENIQYNNSRNNAVQMQGSNTNVNTNPLMEQQRIENIVIEQSRGNNSQRLIDSEKNQETLRSTSVITDNEITTKIVRNQEIVVQEITEVVFESKDITPKVVNENELNIAFSFPKLEIVKEEKKEIIKEQKEIVANPKLDISFQKKKNISKSKKIKQSKKNKNHLYRQKIKGQKILRSKLKYIKNTTLKVKTKKPYCRVVCYKF